MNSEYDPVSLLLYVGVILAGTVQLHVEVTINIILYLVYAKVLHITVVPGDLFFSDTRHCHDTCTLSFLHLLATI